MARLTVLICTHNREQLLAKVLASLNAAERPMRWAVDLLVVANACRDGTHRMLDDYCRHAHERGQLPLAWLMEPAPGKSNALNTAMPLINGDIVAFVDDDHRVDSGYLAAVCHAADSYPEADLLCGRIFPDWDGSEPGWVHDDGPYRIYPLPVPRFDQGDASRELTPTIAIPGGGNLAARAPWLAKVGPFATDMGPMGHDLGGAEDLDWVLRALRSGARLRYVPDMVQYHYVDPSRLTLPYLMKKAYKRTESTVGLDSENARGPVPRYIFRKLAEYGIKAGISLSSARRRFYLVRSAAALGELVGHWRLRRHAAARLAAYRQPE
ncbi:glycosyltransferase [Calidifontimicrobium sp. SYSU G02091]|uniref:glycosyltransferase n=1 Tax=Calidifontimicrobium sp. SYSU G02091 TaxID=2926421 RepID=UPI001F53BDF7|nr:glycosyltransferase family 2 protein [Calidifontimicrobium sp. SYSU G02091]MCI1193142.1 glycosyltransferase [Calidifontimicrobium sp. SYSU G02091]